MLVHFDFTSGVPLYRQLRDQIVLAVAEGRLRPGEKLPPVRILAEESGVNVMTVSKAYQQLKAEGYLQTDRRGGSVMTIFEIDQPVPEAVRKKLEQVPCVVNVIYYEKEED